MIPLQRANQMDMCWVNHRRSPLEETHKFERFIHTKARLEKGHRYLQRNIWPLILTLELGAGSSPLFTGGAHDMTESRRYQVCFSLNVGSLLCTE